MWTAAAEIIASHSNVFAGAISHSMRDFFNLSSADFVSNSIPIAAILEGSGNGYATSVCGVHDAASSAITIALGKTFYTDVSAIAMLDDDTVMVKPFGQSSILTTLNFPHAN